MIEAIIRFFTHRKVRVKLVPRAKGPPIPVKQVLWLHLVWRNVEAVDAKRNKLRQEILEADQKIRTKMQELPIEESKVKAEVDKVEQYGDRLFAIGPTEEEKGNPFFVRLQPFIADPGKLFDDFKKRWEKGQNPGDKELPKWPPEGVNLGTGGQHTHYIPEEVYQAAISHGVVVEGRDARYIMPFKKPQQGGNQNQSRKPKQSGNQNQNQGGNQNN